MFECEYSSFDELPEIDGINWSEARKYHEDVDMLCMLLGEYRKNVEGHISSIEKYCSLFPDEKAVEDFIIRIHSVKGTSAWIGAVHISETARRLEGYAKEMKLDSIKDELPSFLDEYSKLKENLGKVSTIEIDL